MSDLEIQGHCHCQRVQFTLTPPTEFCGHCHCESCRRVHGAAFVTWTSVSDKQLQVNRGKDFLKSYESSPGISWIHCSHCASSLFQTTKLSTGRTYINVAALSTPLDRLPENHVSYEERVDWFNVCDKLPKYKEKASERLE